MEKENSPAWLNKLERGELEFMRQFVLCSGSLKSMAKRYDVSYPTIRLRVDRLIQKISDVDQGDDRFIELVKNLALDGEMSYETAKKLISTYRQLERR